MQRRRELRKRELIVHWRITQCQDQPWLNIYKINFSFHLWLKWKGECFFFKQHLPLKQQKYFAYASKVVFAEFYLRKSIRLLERENRSDRTDDHNQNWHEKHEVKNFILAADAGHSPVTNLEDKYCKYLSNVSRYVVMLFLPQTSCV